MYHRHRDSEDDDQVSGLIALTNYYTDRLVCVCVYSVVSCPRTRLLVCLCRERHEKQMLRKNMKQAIGTDSE